MPKKFIDLSKRVIIFAIMPFGISIPLLFNDCITPRYRSDMDALRKQEAWVDSVYQALDEDERIGQLFSIRAHSNFGEAHHQAVEKLIREYHVGGLTFFQGGPYRQARLTNRYQKLSKVPLMIAIDAEWGLQMRLDSTMGFPRNMTLGAIYNDSLIYEMGREMAKQCQRIGIHVNFAPVVDVNNNPQNPVIDFRSFGEDKNNVARKGVALMNGLQSNRVIANAKHFPGHGDTGQDSHYTLPVINHQWDRLKDIELYPFQQLVDNGLKSTMVAHLHIPSLDPTPNRPTTLSKNVVTNVLQDSLGFEGLVFTDALEMQGVIKYYQPGEISVLSLLAGNDVLLVPKDVPKAHRMIKAALSQGRLKWEDINKKVKKVLRAKYFVGLNNYKPIEIKNIDKDINNPKAKKLRRELYLKAMTVAKNDEKLIPFRKLDSLTFGSVSVGLSKANVFQKTLSKYADFDHHQVSQNAYPNQFNALIPKLKDKKVVVVGLHSLSRRAKEGYKISANTRNFIKSLEQYTKVVVVVFGSPYSLKYFDQSGHVLCAYEENYTTQTVVPQILFGAYGAEGRLPVTASEKLPLGHGVRTPSLYRLGYSIPESVGMSSDTLKKIDEIVQEAIKLKAIPGCQVLIARKGQVIWNQAYGHQTYAKRKAITQQTVYDVASITKVSATLQAIKYLYDRDSLDLDAKISTYLSEFKNSNKADITLKEVLCHQAGLIPFEPYWEWTLNDQKGLDPLYYRKSKSADFPNVVAQGIYSSAQIEDTLWKWVLDSKVKAERKDGLFSYVYSDLSFYILKRLAEQKLGEPIENFLSRNLYKPLGMYETNYLPLNKFSKDRIAPTEKDSYFRQQLVQGYVHDQGAALLGGIGGHAGLFSTTNDLAKILQMHLQEGYYGGKYFLKAKTVQLFTKKQYPDNRRGLGWDKPDEEEYSYIPTYASAESYGHSGFTGCVIWVEPKEDLFIVFLSNRIYPSADNTILINKHIRRKVLNQAYLSIISKSD